MMRICPKILPLLLLLSISLRIPTAFAQVTVLDKAPTSEQLMRVLDEPKPEPEPAPIQTRGRSIGPLRGGTSEDTPGDTRGPGQLIEKVKPSGNPLTPSLPRPILPVWQKDVTFPILFDLSSSTVSAGEWQGIAAVSQVLAQRPGWTLVIQGHADASGNSIRNLFLSWERALAVYRLLVEKFGVNPDRLQVLGKGNSEPLAGYGSFDGRNRRVQFQFQKWQD